MPELRKRTVTIDGKPVRASNLSHNAASRGDDQARFIIPEADVRREGIEQGAPVAVFAESSDPVWQGELSGPPSLDSGVAQCAADGYVARLVEGRQRLLFMTRDYAGWQDGGDEPYDFTTSEKIEAEARKSFLFFRTEKDLAYTLNQAHYLVFSATGSTTGITKYAFNIVKEASTGNLSLRTQRFAYPSGARNTIATHGLAGADPTSISQTVASAQDSITLGAIVVNAYTEAVWRPIRVNNVRVYGIASSDTYTVQDVLSYLASQQQWTDAVSTELDLNCLPQDWLGSHADLADYVVMLQDGWYRVSGQKLEADLWSNSRNWTTTRQHCDLSGLTRLKQAGYVQVNYQLPSGAPGEYITAQSANGLDNVYEFDMEDGQSGTTLVEAVAANLLAQLESEAYSGTIPLGHAVDDSGNDNIRDAKAGDTLTVSDFDSGQSFTFRLHDVSQEDTQVVAATNWEASAAAVIAKADLHKERRKHRTKKKRRR